MPFWAADMTALPIRSRTLAAIVSFYAVIHLCPAERAAAYREFARTLRPDGCALIAFHSSDPDARTGEVTTLPRGFNSNRSTPVVKLNFRFLGPVEELDMLAAAGLEVEARLDRAPYDGCEHPSQRCYLLLRRP